MSGAAAEGLVRLKISMIIVSLVSLNFGLSKSLVAEGHWEGG
jgi:hypothetical protein